MTARGVLPLLVTLPLAAAAACTSALPHATPGDLRWARQRWPGTGEQDLSAGRALYVETCSGCHNLHLPTDLPQGRWQHTVRLMQTEHGVRITPGNEQLIVKYLVTMSWRDGRGE